MQGDHLNLPQLDLDAKCKLKVRVCNCVATASTRDIDHSRFDGMFHSVLSMMLLNSGLCGLFQELWRDWTLAKSY